MVKRKAALKGVDDALLKMLKISKKFGTDIDKKKNVII